MIDLPALSHLIDGATDLDHDSFDLIIPPPPIPNESEESDVSDEDFSRIPAPPLSPVDSNDLEENVAPPPDDSDGSDVGLSKFPAVVDLSTYFQSSENQDSVFFDDSCRTESPKTSLIDSEDMSSAWAENKNGNEENIISDSAEEAGEEGERVISDKGFSKRLSLQSQVTRSRAIIETDDEDDTDAAEIDYVAEDNQTQPESNDTEAAIEANNVSLKRWSSFSSTSTDEERTAKKLNIVKLMEQRTKSFTSDSDNGRNRGKFRKTLRYDFFISYFILVVLLRKSAFLESLKRS